MINKKVNLIVVAAVCALSVSACGSRTVVNDAETAATEQAVTEAVTQEMEAEVQYETKVPELITIAAEEESEPQTEAVTEKESETSIQIPMLTFPTPSEVTYINGILVVNKTYGLPSDYNPGENSEARAAFDRMADAAAADGIHIFVASGFRSYDHQMRTYSRYVYYDGQEAADTYSARPGYSEHQTGLAFDMNSVDDSFAGTPEALWVAEHCHEYGFIIRYPEGKEDITGYQYEPWHVRYLGVDTAAAVYESGLTLEEYLGIDSKYKE